MFPLDICRSEAWSPHPGSLRPDPDVTIWDVISFQGH